MQVRDMPHPEQYAAALSQFGDNMQAHYAAAAAVSGSQPTLASANGYSFPPPNAAKEGKFSILLSATLYTNIAICLLLCSKSCIKFASIK